MDRQMDGGSCNIPIAFLKKRGDNNRFHTLLMDILLLVCYKYFTES